MGSVAAIVGPAAAAAAGVLSCWPRARLVRALGRRRREEVESKGGTRRRVEGAWKLHTWLKIQKG